MEDLFEWLAEEVIGSLDGAVDDLGAFLANCDYLTVTLQDLERLEEFSEEASLFALAAPNETATYHSRAVTDADANDSTPDHGGTPERKSKAQIVKEEALETAKDILRTEGAILVQQAIARRDAPEVPLPRHALDGSHRLALADADVELDLFNISDLRAVPKSRCVCAMGAENGYPFVITATCPFCGGNDPLGYLWERYRNAILGASKRTIHERCCAVPSGLFHAIATIESEITAVIRSANNLDRFAKIQDGDDPQLIAKSLIAFFDPVVDVTNSNVRSEVFDGIRVAARDEIGMICQVLQTEGKRLRSKLLAGCGDFVADAWRPSPAFHRTLAHRLDGIWKEPFQRLHQVGVALIAASVAYEPVRKVFVAQSQPQPLGMNLAKTVWTGVKAANSGGISLAFDVGKMFFNAHRESQRLESFRILLDEALNECYGLYLSISAAQGMYRDMLAQLSEKLTYQLIFGIAPIYGELPPRQQEEVAAAVARMANLSVPDHSSLLERGDAAALRREEARRAAEKEAARRERLDRLKKWWLDRVVWPLVLTMGAGAIIVLILMIGYTASGATGDFWEWVRQTLFNRWNQGVL